MICYNLNSRDTKKLNLTNLENSKNSNNLIIKKYLTERSDLIKYLDKLTKIFKYTDKTFFFAVSLFDTFFSLLNNKNFFDFKIDSILISCLLIAGN